MTAFWVIVVAGIGTYAARAVFIVAVGDRELPPVVERGLLYVGPAVLAALAASLLTSPDGVVAFLGNIPEVVASTVGVVTALRFRRFDVSFVAAMTVFFTLTALL
jgi:branched-subunit amino acid transport protein